MMDDRKTNPTTEPISLEYESPHLRLKNQLITFLGQNDANTIYLTVAGGAFYILGMHTPNEVIFFYGTMMLIGGLVCGFTIIGARNLTKPRRYRIGILIVLVWIVSLNLVLTSGNARTPPIFGWD